MKLLEEIQNEVEAEKIIDLSEAIRTLALGDTTGKYVSASGVIMNPLIAGGAALLAMSAYDNYKKNKLYTTRFYAKTSQEMSFYDKIVKDLMKTGHYKLVKSKYISGGKLWELKRTGS